MVIYNPVSAQWADGPPLHTARIEPIVATVAGRVYAAGGGDLDGALLDSVESIGPGESAWQMEPSLPVPMRQFAGCVLNDCLYICGKAGGFAYDPNKKTWDQLPAMPTDPPQAPLVAAHKEAMWVIGGYKTDAVWRYHPEEKNGLKAPGSRRYNHGARPGLYKISLWLSAVPTGRRRSKYLSSMTGYLYWKKPDLVRIRGSKQRIELTNGPSCIILEPVYLNIG